MLVLKLKQNVAYYQLKTLRKQSISRRVQSVRPSLYTSSKTFDEAQYGHVGGVLWQIVPH